MTSSVAEILGEKPETWDEHFRWDCRCEVHPVCDGQGCCGRFEGCANPDAHSLRWYITRRPREELLAQRGKRAKIWHGNLYKDGAIVAPHHNSGYWFKVDNYKRYVFVPNEHILKIEEEVGNAVDLVDGSIVRAQVYPSSQTRKWRVVNVKEETIVLQSAWEDEKHKAPNYVYGKPKEVHKRAVTRVEIIHAVRHEE